MFFMCSRCTMPIDESRGEYDVMEHEPTFLIGAFAVTAIILFFVVSDLRGRQR